MRSASRATGVVDVPIREDAHDVLGLLRYAEALGRFVLECETPMTVGIQGDWGAGKTSLMNLIDGWLRRQTQAPVPPTLTLNTWQYAQLCEGNELALLLLRALQERVGAKDDSVARVWAQMAGAFSRVKSFGLGGVVEVEMGPSPTLPDLSQLKQGFAASVRARLAGIGDGHDRVVVFIDDLDRVLPERAVEILEALKNFVDVPGCVFVLACDYAVVTKGLKKKFDVGTEDLGGRSFFDKIIQVPFRMPVHHYEIDRYVRSMLERIGWQVYRDDISIYERLIELSVGFNPRGLKRLCNTLLLLRMVAEGSSDASELVSSAHRLALLFALVCMESSHERLYARVARGSVADLRHVFDAAAREGDGSEGALDGHELSPGECAFLRQLASLVDVDANNEISDAELQPLVQMLKLSAVTALVEEPRASSAPIEENIVAKARSFGPLQEEYLRRCQQLLDPHVGPGHMKKRVTAGSIVYDLQRRDANRWAPFAYLTPHVNGFQVGLFVPTIVHFNDESSEWPRVLEDLRRRGAHETEGQNIVRVSVSSDESLTYVLGILRRLAPLDRWI